MENGFELDFPGDDDNVDRYGTAGDIPEPDFASLDLFAESNPESRLFALQRNQDVTGVSGTGLVANGVQFADGTVVIRWQGETPSTVIWASLDDAMRIHGHGGKTRVVWQS